MGVIPWEIATLLVVLASASKFLDLWLWPIEKSRLQRRINSLSCALKQSHPLVVIKAPLQMASIVLERIYGPRLLSWKAFWRAAVLSMALMLFGLTVFGIASGVPFGIHEPPWSTFNQTLDDIEQVVKEQAKRKPTNHRWMEGFGDGTQRHSNSERCGRKQSIRSRSLHW
jgi:hypothetical protein